MKRFDPRRLLFDREVLGLMGLGLLVKPIGLFNQVLIARYFGAGESLDAYALAFFLVTFGDGTLSRVFKASMAPHLIKLKRVLDADTFARYQNGVAGLFLGTGAIWLAAPLEASMTSFIPSMAISTVPCPVSIMTSVNGFRFLIVRRTSVPSTPGKRTSRITTSKL